MSRVRKIFAENLKQNRYKCGFSQEKLAEKAEISTHYIAMIELARNFPKSEVIERLADALGIEVHELFAVSRSPEDELDKLHRTIISDIKETIAKSVELSVNNAFEKRAGLGKNLKND